MSSDLVVCEQQTEAIAVCTLNRSEKRNALSIQLMQQLCAHVERIEKDGTARILILRGNGPAFCAGLDVGEAMDPELGLESAKMVRRSLMAIYQTPMVTIAMVKGPAMGGGAGLVAACDFAVADKDATVGFPEVRRGLVPAQVMGVLVRKLKRSEVRELLLSGESITADRALQMGLFNRLGAIDAEVQVIVSQVLQGAPGAIAKTKHLMNQLYPRNLRDDSEMCCTQYLQARETVEAREGIRAFLEKRRPAWHPEAKSQNAAD